MSINIKKLSFLCLFLFTLSFVSAEPCEGYWISYHFTKKYVQAAWRTYVTEKGTLQGDTVALTEVRAEEAKAVGFKGKRIKDYPLEVEGDFGDFSTINTPWIFGLEKKSEGVWENGTICDPSSGKIYQCRMFYHPADGKKFQKDTLEVRGEIVRGIGASIFWTRCTREEALNIQLK